MLTAGRDQKSPLPLSANAYCVYCRKRIFEVTGIENEFKAKATTTEEADGDDIPGGDTRKQSRKGNKSGKRASRKTRAGDGGEEGDIDNDGQAACMEIMASSPVAPARASHSSSTSTTDSTYVMVD